MASPAEAAAPSFSHVTFTDTPHSYPPSTPITCTYTLCPSFLPHSRDWVGIFKVGWSSTKDYYTFVWVEQSQDVSGQRDDVRQVAFKGYYLPRDDLDFYQFCYVDSGGQVRGASTSFCFSNPTEQSGEEEEDLLVITTQEQVEQGVREKADLQRELQRVCAENKSLQSALQGAQRQTRQLEEEIEKKDKELSEVVKERHQTRREPKNAANALQQRRRENQRSKDETIQQKRQDQRLTTDGHKEEKPVTKIQQQKEELDGLRRTVEALREEIATLNAAVRAGEQELSKAKDIVQLLQVDLQSSEKDKERLSAELQNLQGLIQNMEEMEKKNQELSRRLAGAERSPPDEALQDRCQSLVRELEGTRTKNVVQGEELKNLERKGAHLEREFQQVSEQLEKMMNTLEAEQRKSNKYELQLREVANMMAEKDIVMGETETTLLLERQEKEELSRENETLRRDNEGLRRSYAELHRVHSNTAAQNISSNPQQNAGRTENLYQAIGSVEEPRVNEPSPRCGLCQESFPGVTPGELELHRQSHRVCPFCSVLCDAMEQTEFEDHVYAHEL